MSDKCQITESCNTLLIRAQLQERDKRIKVLEAENYKMMEVIDTCRDALYVFANIYRTTREADYEDVLTVADVHKAYDALEAIRGWRKAVKDE